MEANYNIIETKSASEVLVNDYEKQFGKSLGKTNLRFALLGCAFLSVSANGYSYEFEQPYKYKIIDRVEFTVDETDNGNRLCNDNLDETIEVANKLAESNFTQMQVVRDILSYKSLTQSWDGYGAVSLEIESATNAITFITNLDKSLVGKIEDYYPNTHGTISFEWKNEFKEKLFLEIGNESFSYFVKYANQEPKFFDDQNFVDGNIQLLSDYIQSI